MKLMLRALLTILLLALSGPALGSQDVEKFLAKPRFKRVEVVWENTGRTFTGSLEEFGYFFVFQPGGTNPPFVAGLNHDLAWMVAGTLGVVARTNEFWAHEVLARQYTRSLVEYPKLGLRNLTNLATLYLTAAVPGSIEIDGNRFSAVSRENGKPFTGLVLRDTGRISGFSYSANGFTNLLTYEYDPALGVELPGRMTLQFGGAETGRVSVIVKKWDLSETDPVEGLFPSTVLPDLKLTEFVMVTNGVAFTLNPRGKFDMIWTSSKPRSWLPILIALPLAFLAALLWRMSAKKENNPTQ